MEYISYYSSKLGRILLSSDELGLTGLWFNEQRFYAKDLDKNYEEKETDFISKAKNWLDIYFSGKNPSFKVPLHLLCTPFQKRVCEIMMDIPYGATITYGDIARIIATERGLDVMSSQAVGQAVGHNNISIIIPCHRVMGKNGNLTGYGGGLWRKVELLKLENVDISSFSYPNKKSPIK